ncbi:MAG: type VI secretion system baseplate subunit TssK [Sulfuricurvum sp.]|nr:type VI secretion system baseplate subunit TssK [Sulfuricurvum sp.]
MINKVVWREGLFIRPQHFQQNDRHFEYELRTRTNESGSNRWGLYDLNIDTQFLNSGKFVLNRAYGIMPDGTLFDIDIKQYNLILDINTKDSGKTIYLALPLCMHYTDDVSFEEDNIKATRMIARRERDVPNTNVGESTSVELLLAQPNFRLLRDEELNEGYDVIAIARVGSVSASGTASLDENFIPTYLHLHRCHYLLAQLKELMSILNFRMLKLSEKLSDVTIQVAELGDYLLLQLLNRFHSRFYFFLTQEKIHPDMLFLELSSLAAELAVFMKKDRHLEKEYIYDHIKQKESFIVLLVELKNMLSMVLEQNSFKLIIEQRKYGIYVAKVEDKTLIDNGSFVIAVTADMATEKLKKLLLDNLKLGTIETIRDLVNYHLAGFKIKPLPAAPRQIPYRVNHIYFKIELSSEDKRTLQSSGGIAFYLAGEVEGIDYDLWAIRSNKE